MNKMNSGSKENRKKEEIDQALEEEIQASLMDGKLPCAAAFKIAEKLKANRREIGAAANKLGIKISSCQLGCFP